MSCSGLEAINPACQLGSLSASAATRFATAAFDAIAKQFARVASDAVNWLWTQLSSATAIDLSGAGIHGLLGATAAIALVVTTILFLVQIITSALRREPGGLGRALRGIVVSFLGASFAVGCIGVLLGLVDALSSGVVQVTLGTNLQGLGAKLVAVGALATVSPAATLLISLTLLAAVVVVWAALMVRKLLVIVAAVFAPVAFSGASADITKGWIRRWIEFSVALVASKLVLVLIFMIGLAVLDGAGSTGHGAAQDVTQLMVGTLLLLLGGFAPWMAVKMVHFAGDGFSSLHGHAAVAGAGARQVIAAPQKLTTAGQQLARPLGAFGFSTGRVSEPAHASTAGSSSVPDSSPRASTSTSGWSVQPAGSHRAPPTPPSTPRTSRVWQGGAGASANVSATPTAGSAMPGATHPRTGSKVGTSEPTRGSDAVVETGAVVGGGAAVGTHADAAPRAHAGRAPGRLAVSDAQGPTNPANGEARAARPPGAPTPDSAPRVARAAAPGASTSTPAPRVVPATGTSNERKANRGERSSESGGGPL